MRKLAALSFVLLANIPFTAQAAVSDDLKFCSNLTDRTERIACYNAAARIAETARHRSKGAAIATPTVTMRSAATAAVAPSHAIRSYDVPFNRFDGFYAAVGATYGTSTARPFGGATSDFNFTGETMPQGPSGIAATGYNFTTGRLLFGLELDGRWGRETASTTLIQPGFADPTGVFGSTGKALFTYKVVSDLAAHVSLRAGGVVGDTLLFGKVGVGAARVTDTYGIDLTQLSTCTQFTFPGPCLARQFGGAAIQDTAKWAPAFLFGVGAEYNVSNFFVRVSAEAEMVGSQKYLFFTPLSGADVTRTNSFLIGNSTDFNAFWTARAGGLIGVRF